MSRASEHLSGFARDVSVPMASVRASGEFAEGGVYYYAYYYHRGYGQLGMGLSPWWSADNIGFYRAEIGVFCRF